MVEDTGNHCWLLLFIILVDNLSSWSYWLNQGKLLLSYLLLLLLFFLYSLFHFSNFYILNLTKPWGWLCRYYEVTWVVILKFALWETLVNVCVWQNTFNRCYYIYWSGWYLEKLLLKIFLLLFFLFILRHWTDLELLRS